MTGLSKGRAGCCTAAGLNHKVAIARLLIHPFPSVQFTDSPSLKKRNRRGGIICCFANRLLLLAGQTGLAGES